MQDRYAAYLLRLWQVGDDGDTLWRASLEDPHTGECLAFSSRQALYAFLDALTTAPPPPIAPPTKE